MPVPADTGLAVLGVDQGTFDLRCHAPDGAAPLSPGSVGWAPHPRDAGCSLLNDGDGPLSVLVMRVSSD